MKSLKLLETLKARGSACKAKTQVLWNCFKNDLLMGGNMDKYLFYGMTGDKLCFQHVLLNALALAGKGKTVKIIFEGGSVKLLPQFIMENNPLFLKARELDLIAGVCLGCSRALGVADRLKDSGLPMLNDLSGHAGMDSYIEDGYTVISM